MKKWHRRVAAAMPEGVRAEATNGHMRLICEGCGKPITTCSGSPKNPDNTIRAILRDVRRYVRPHLLECPTRQQPGG